MKVALSEGNESIRHAVRVKTSPSLYDGVADRWTRRHPCYPGIRDGGKAVVYGSVNKSARAGVSHHQPALWAWRHRPDRSITCAGCARLGGRGTPETPRWPCDTARTGSCQ